MTSRTKKCVECTADGIVQVGNLPDVDDSDSDEGGSDSEIDENLELCKLEKRDFDDVEGI
jgi:hypothetical protein